MIPPLPFFTRPGQPALKSPRPCLTALPVLLAAAMAAAAHGQTLIPWNTSGYSYSYNVESQVSDGLGGSIGLQIVPTPSFGAPAWTQQPVARTNDSDLFIKQANFTGELGVYTFADGGPDTIRQSHASSTQTSPYTYTWVFDFSTYNSPDGLGATSDETILFISDVYSGVSTGDAKLTFSAAVLGGGTVNFSSWGLLTSNALSPSGSNGTPYMDYTFANGVLDASTTTTAPGAPGTGSDGVIAALKLGSQRYTSITIKYEDVRISAAARADNWAFAVATIPEPSSALFLIGGGMLGIFRRRREGVL